jgi:hypothetical protein
MSCLPDGEYLYENASLRLLTKPMNVGNDLRPFRFLLSPLLVPDFIREREGI